MTEHHRYRDIRSKAHKVMEHMGSHIRVELLFVALKYQKLYLEELFFQHYRILHLY